jgi:bifunctional non-homologous end joining protein LigD
MALERYRQMRNFRNTPEPRGKVLRSDPRELRFIVQKHRASHLHYDFRLELDGVLLSWAVPKGPSLDPKEKRLAMHTEDHPIEYGDFEGVIPPGQYGSGTVMLWDRGRWIPEDDDPRAAYRKGKLKFSLDGEKLHGSWALVRSWDKGREDKRWLLLKHDDEFAQAGSGSALVDEEDRSVVSGRDLDEIAAANDAEWSGRKSVAQNLKAGALARATLDPSQLDGARKAKMPAMVGAQLCTLVKQVPPGAEWLHEIKYDGYRMLTRLEKGRAAIYSRNRKEWTEDLGPVARAVETLPVQQAWLDGEVVVLLPDGRSSFQALQLAIGTQNQQLTYFVFDLLYLDGWDLRACPLVERKALLKKLLAGRKSVLRYGDHHEGDGERFFAAACAGRLEGIVCKQRDGEYHSTRGSGWVKVKCSLRQELVIGGWTDPGGARTGFGALLLGAYDEAGKLGYVGKVGTGFDTKTLKDIHARLRKLERDTPAFANPPRGADARGAHWVEPTLVGEIEFTEWTREGTARHPSFKGLRLDKAAKDVHIERPADDPLPEPVGKSARWKKREVVAAPVAESPRPRSRAHRGEERIELTNPDKVLYPEAGITKREIAEYYRAIGEWMLPHLEGRPLTLVRCPNGYGAKCFYQKHVKDGTPEILTRVQVPEGDGTGIYMAADSVEAIVALLQMGVLEIHPWGSRVPKLDRPDRIIFDFDPDEGLGWQEVVDAATTMGDALEKLGLASFLKTTGGKGLHVVVPIEPKLPWDVVKAFTKAVAESFAATWPDKFTAKLAKASRGQKIFIDYLRNAEGATAIAPYSVRAKKNAPVSMPIDWRELRNDVRFDFFNVRNAPTRLKKQKRDPWHDFLDTRQTLTKAMLRSVGVSL